MVVEDKAYYEDLLAIGEEYEKCKHVGSNSGGGLTCTDGSFGKYDEVYTVTVHDFDDCTVVDPDGNCTGGLPSSGTGSGTGGSNDGGGAASIPPGDGSNSGANAASSASSADNTTTRDEHHKLNGLYAFDLWKDILLPHRQAIDAQQWAFNIKDIAALETHFSEARDYLENTLYANLDNLDLKYLDVRVEGIIQKLTDTTLFGGLKSEASALIANIRQASQKATLKHMQVQRLFFANLILLQFTLPEFFIASAKKFRNNAAYLELFRKTYKNAMADAATWRTAELDRAEAHLTNTKDYFLEVQDEYKDLMALQVPLYEDVITSWKDWQDCVDTDLTDGVNPCSDRYDDYVDLLELRADEADANVDTYNQWLGPRTTQHTDERTRIDREYNQTVYQDPEGPGANNDPADDLSLCTDTFGDCKHNESPREDYQRELTDSRQDYIDELDEIRDEFGDASGTLPTSLVTYLTGLFYEVRLYGDRWEKELSKQVGLKRWNPKTQDESDREKQLSAVPFYPT